MGAPRFRFTLSNEVLGNLVIDDPVGWDEITPELDRDKKGHGLVEIIDTPLTFWGKGGAYDGGLTYMRTVEETQGPAAKVSLLCEIDPRSTGDWRFLYNGRVDIVNKTDIIEGKSYKWQAPILRDDFWSEFISRKSTQVDMRAIKDLYGNARTPGAEVTLKLPAQIINKRSQYTGHSGDDDTLQPCFVATTGNIALSGLPVIDGVQTTENMRVWVRAQSAGEQNGAWNASAVGWTRTSDANTGDELENAIVSIESGDTLAGKVYRVDQDNITLNTTAITSTEYNYVDEYELATNGTVENVGNAWTFYTSATLDENISEITDTNTVAMIPETTPNDILEQIEINTESGPLRLHGSMDMSLRWAFEAQTSAIIESHHLRVRWYVQLNDDSPILLDTYEITDPIPVDYPKYFTLNADQTINTFKGDRVKTYLEWFLDAIWDVNTGTFESRRVYGGIVNQEVNFDFKSTLPATETPGYLLHDAYGYICDRILGGTGHFYSSTLGSESTLYRVYDTAGCHWKYIIAKGLHLRGYTLTEKPFFASFDEIHEGADPILCLGYNLEKVDGVDKLVIAERSHFYDSSSNSILLSNVANITSTYFEDNFYKKIRIGYERWESEDVGGIDDPQTKREFATFFATIGTELEIYSKFIAASLAIETTRRTTREKTSDWKYDNNIFIFAVKPDVAKYAPELGSDFESVSNLNDADTRYNLRITATRNLLRFLDYVSGCLHWYPGSEFTFQSGEGNFVATTEMAADGCAGDFGGNPLTENQDIPRSETPLFIPRVKTFTHPLSFDEYDLIRENKNLSIGISTTNVAHVSHFIMNLKYLPPMSKGEFVAIEA